MKFFKENSSLIFRLIITHIGMSVFGLVIFLATNRQGDNFMLLASIFSTLFFAVITYSTTWEYGSKDKPAIDAGRISFKLSNIFYSALVAEALGIALIFVYLISSFFVSGSDLATSAFGISYLLLYLAESCISGFMLFFHHMFENPIVNSLCFMILPLTVCLSATLGYAFGAKGITITPKKQIQKK